MTFRSFVLKRGYALSMNNSADELIANDYFGRAFSSNGRLMICLSQSNRYMIGRVISCCAMRLNWRRKTLLIKAQPTGNSRALSTISLSW